jgi:hypothetical protein
MEALGILIVLLVIAVAGSALVNNRDKRPGPPVRRPPTPLRSPPPRLRPPPPRGPGGAQRRPPTGATPNNSAARRPTRVRVRPAPGRSPGPPRAAGPPSGARRRPRVGSVPRVRLKRVEAEGCSYCGALVRPGEPAARCSFGHSHHAGCLRDGMGGACAMPHCPDGRR